MALSWWTSMPRTSAFCSKNCAGAWKSRGCRRRSCFSRRRSTFRRGTRNGSRATCGPAKDGNRHRGVWAEHIQDRQSAGIRQRSDAVQFIQGVIDELKSASSSSSPLRLGEDMIAKTVCRHAVKANDPLRLSGDRKADPGLAGMRPALLLSPRTADHDPDLACGAGKEIRAEGLTASAVTERSRTGVVRFFLPACCWPSFPKRRRR